MASKERDDNLKKTTLALLLFTFLLLSSSVMVGSVFAQSIPKPSVPEFTVTLRDQSYYVPPTYRTDPYTGTSELIQQGYVAQNGTIELSIEPQQYTQYTDSEGNIIRLYFRVAYKGHSALGWNYYPKNDGFSANYSQYISASDSGSTIVLFGFGEYEFGGEDRTIYTYPSFGEIPAGGQIDFKVEAFVGYYTTSEYVGIFGLRYYQIYAGESSDWSETQTISIPENNPFNPVPTSTPMPHEVPETSELEVILCVIFMVTIIGGSLGLLVYLIKRK